MTGVTYHGGALLEHIELVCIYLNVTIDGVPADDWSAPDLCGMASSLDTFLDIITASTYLDALTEYAEGTPYHIGRGRRLQSYFLRAGPFNKNEEQTNVIATSPEPAVLDEASAHNWAHVVPWLQQRILDGTLPAPGTNRCFVVFLSPGITLALGIGLHDSFHVQTDDAKEVYYIVVVYPDGERLFDQFTLTLTHEIVEVITNPSHARSGWHTDDEASSEIADLCEKAQYNCSFNGYQVVSFWSWKRNECVQCRDLIVPPVEPGNAS